MTSIFVRHAQRSGPSGRKIARMLRRFLPSSFIGAGRTVNDQNHDLIINWGGGSSLPRSMVFNRPESILISSDKILTFEKLEDAGIQVPYWDYVNNWRTGFPETWAGTGIDVKFPILARKRHGKRGLGIEFCESYLQAMGCLNTHDFFSEFIDKKYEFRVHVAFGQVVKLSQKVFDPSKGKRYQDRIWNHQRGFVFKNPRDEISPELLERVRQFGIESIKCVNLDFGAVDLIVDENEVIWVLETNTAPGLVDSTAIAYAKRFSEIILQNDRN